MKCICDDLKDGIDKEMEQGDWNTMYILKQGEDYYTIVKEVLGEKWLTNKWFRLGTSRLANMLLSEIEGKETKFF